MNIKNVLIYLCALIYTCGQNCENSQNSQININHVHDVINREIFISAEFDENGLIVVFEDEEYYLYRNFYTDERLVGTIKYGCIYQDDFSFSSGEIISMPKEIEAHIMHGKSNELFRIYVYRKYLNVSLNGVDVVLKYIK